MLNGSHLSEGIPPFPHNQVHKKPTSYVAGQLYLHTIKLNSGGNDNGNGKNLLPCLILIKKNAP